MAEKVAVTAEPLWLYKVEAGNTKSPSPGAVSNGYYIELTDHQVNLAMQTEYLHSIRHIINESGVQNASEVSVTFAPEFQKIFFHKVILWRNGIIISQLNTAQIKVVQEETEAGDFQYNGIKRAFVIVKGVQKEDRIEFAYSVTGFNPVFGDHFSDKIYFVNSTFVANYFETFIVPAGRKINIKSFNNAPPPAETEQGSMHIYHWSNPPIKLQESQPGVPGWFDNYPYITVSEFSNWQEVIDWGVKLFNNYQYPLTEELKSRIKQWRLIAKGDKDLYTNMAIRFVQDQVRYLGLEMGQYTHQPHTPAVVYHQRFGDCKDKALLLATLLQQENIPAWVALVNTVNRSKLGEATPSTGEFDHAIVAIERSSGFAYVDATAAYQRGELANTFIPAYGYALLLRAGENKLQPVVPGDIYNTTVEEKLKVPYSDSCRMNVITVYRGGAADAMRSNLAEASLQNMTDMYVQYYAKTYDGIRMKIPISIQDDSIKNELTVTENYDMPSLWHNNTKGKRTVEVFAKAIYELIPDPTNAYGAGPVAISFPRTLHYVLEIEMPENWQFPQEGLHIKNDSYQFDFTPELRDNFVRLRYYYKTFKDHIPANEVFQYKEDYKKIESNFNFNLYYDTNTGNQPSDNATPTPATSININWLMVLLAFLFTGGLILLIRYLNKQSSPILYTAGTGWPLGGWTTVLGISLGLSGIIQIIYFIQNKYFSGAVWKTLEATGHQKIQFIFVVEMAIALTLLWGVGALLYWFIKRRDIFPRMFIGYMGIMLTGQLLLLTLYNAIPFPTSYGDIQTPVITQIFKTIVYGAIWVSYVLRSERVKSTFLEPVN